MRQTANPERKLKTFAIKNNGRNAKEGVFRDDSSETSSVSFTPDDKHLITGPGANGEIQIWDIAKGTLIRRIDRVSDGSNGARSAVAKYLTVTPDGREIMSAGNRTVPRDETPLKNVSKNVNLAEIRFWEIATGKMSRVLTGPYDHGFGHAALSANGKRVAVGDFAKLRILDAESGKAEQTISLPGSWGQSTCVFSRRTSGCDGHLQYRGNF